MRYAALGAGRTTRRLDGAHAALCVRTFHHFERHYARTGRACDRKKLRHVAVDKHCNRCGWANAVPSPRPLRWWYSQLARFLIRPSRPMIAALKEYGAPRCPPGLCRPGSRALRAEEAAVRRRERQHALIDEANYRPPFAGEIARVLGLPVDASTPVAAVHVRGGDACNSFSRAQGPSLHRPPCVRGADAWSVVAQALAARGGGGGARPIVLLSTDDDETPAGRDGALSFSFARRKYSHEEGWRRGAPDIEVRQSLPRFDVLRESLLDLGLLAQATLVSVGSFYSNFARIAGGALDYESFDALWCPFAICNAGRTDAALICAGRRPLHIADIEPPPV